ncbi:MAG: RloB family protein [Flavobacterium sp.]
MMEPWEIKTEDSRKVNSKKTFIIFCEDGAVEPAYFELFKREDVHVSAFGNKKQHHAQVDFATEYFRKNDLLELNALGQEILKIDDGAQVWCVFDRDKELNDQKDTAFNDSIQNANSKGIRTAWSNDDFELWILLHFEDVNPENLEYLNRTKYYERLTEILKQLLPEETLFQNPKFDYYNSMKSKNRFIQFTYQLMKDNLEKAFERAEKLEEYHSTIIKPVHLHCPCTKVHHLVKELIKV